MEEGSKRYLFLIQTEGRGHITQAIAFHEYLAKTNCAPSVILYGTRRNHTIPDYFFETFKQIPLVPISTPYLLYNKRRSVSIFKTLLINMLRIPIYILSCYKIFRVIRKNRITHLVNFYELLGGISTFLFPSKAKKFCIAHQLVMLSPDFIHPMNRKFEKFLLTTNSLITAYGAKKIGLSYFKDRYSSKEIHICPPLLRQESRNLNGVDNEPFTLIYLLNSGYLADIKTWHLKHPGRRLVLFSPLKNADDSISNFVLEPLNAEKFQYFMKKTELVVLSAGFESICEALYLGKSIIVIPTEKHYEQACNALELQQNNLAVVRKNYFDLESKIYPNNEVESFRNWIDSSGVLLDSFGL